MTRLALAAVATLAALGTACSKSAPAPEPVTYVSGEIHVDEQGRMQVSVTLLDRERHETAATGAYVAELIAPATGATLCTTFGRFEKTSRVGGDWANMTCRRPADVDPVRVKIEVRLDSGPIDTSYELAAASVFATGAPVRPAVVVDAMPAAPPPDAGAVVVDEATVIATELAALSAIVDVVPAADGSRKPCPAQLPEDVSPPVIDHALLLLLAGRPLDAIDQPWLAFGITSPSHVYLGWRQLGFSTKTQPDTAEARAALARPHRMLWVVRAGDRRRAIAADQHSFTPGSFSGVVALLDLQAHAPLCWAPVLAFNSDHWEYDPRRSSAQAQVDSDLATKVLGATQRAMHELTPALVDEPPAWLE